MARFINCLVACINIITLLVGVTILTVRPFTSCYSLLYKPLMLLGLVLLILSLLGILGICCGSPMLMWLYLLVYLVVILGATFAVLFDVAMMTKEASRLEAGIVGNTGSAGNRLHELAYWMEDHVVGVTDWERVKMCLIQEDVCNFNRRSSKRRLFTIRDDKLFVQLQDGCCKPPSLCGFEHNGTYWRRSEAAAMNNDPDCKAWDNYQGVMCYDCDTCKAGFLADITLVWRKLFPAVVTIHLVLLFVFILGCLAFGHLKSHHSQKQYQAL